MLCLQLKWVEEWKSGYTKKRMWKIVYLKIPYDKKLLLRNLTTFVSSIIQLMTSWFFSCSLAWSFNSNPPSLVWLWILILIDNFLSLPNTSYNRAGPSMNVHFWNPFFLQDYSNITYFFNLKKKSHLFIW